MKQLVVEKNNPTPILWDTPIPNPGPGEILIKTTIQLYLQEQS